MFIAGTGRRGWRDWMVFATLAGIMCGTAGCGAQMGAFLYFLSPPTRKIPAEYKLPPGPILVLVDDDQGLIRPPTARMALVDSLARELKLHKITDKVTTNEELARMRQAEPNFDQRGARELGQLAEADTVLLLSTQAFSIEEDLEMASMPGRFAVTVRVINANAEKLEDVRLWPPMLTEREGRLVEAVVSPHELRAAGSASDAHGRLADALAVKIAELFYDREVAQ